MLEGVVHNAQTNFALQLSQECLSFTSCQLHKLHHHREGVEKIDNTCGLLPATVKQKELIADILSKIEDADRMHEYYDYLQRSTRENATEFITQVLENNLDIKAKKKNYIDYLANRPRVERIGTHGLFSNEGSLLCCTVWQRRWQIILE